MALPGIWGVAGRFCLRRAPSCVLGKSRPGSCSAGPAPRFSAWSRAAGLWLSLQGRCVGRGRAGRQPHWFKGTGRQHPQPSAFSPSPCVTTCGSLEALTLAVVPCVPFKGHVTPAGVLLARVSPVSSPQMRAAWRWDPVMLAAQRALRNARGMQLRVPRAWSVLRDVRVLRTPLGSQALRRGWRGQGPAGAWTGPAGGRRRAFLGVVPTGPRGGALGRRRRVSGGPGQLCHPPCGREQPRARSAPRCLHLPAPPSQPHKGQVRGQARGLTSALLSAGTRRW